MIGPRRALVLAPFVFSPQACQFFARLTTQPIGARKQLYAALINSLVWAGVWAKLDVLCVLAAVDAATALTNLKSASFAPTAVSSPTFTADRGYAGDGAASYLDTNFNMSTAGGNFTQNSNSYGFYNRTDEPAGGGNLVDMGTNVGAAGCFIRDSNGSQNFIGLDLGSTAISVSNAVNTVGHYAVSRTASNAWAAYRDGASIGTETATPGALQNINMTVCALNNNGSMTQFKPNQYADYFIGGGLTAGEMAALNSALQAYRTAVGA